MVDCTSNALLLTRKCPCCIKSCTKFIVQSPRVFHTLFTNKDTSLHKLESLSLSSHSLFVCFRVFHESYRELGAYRRSACAGEALTVRSELTEAQVAREAPLPFRGKAAPALWHSICDDNVPIYVFGYGWRSQRPYGALQCD